jgi:hypothetical protein
VEQLVIAEFSLLPGPIQHCATVSASDRHLRVEGFVPQPLPFLFRLEERDERISATLGSAWLASKQGAS